MTWRPLDEAPYDKYVLCYGAKLPWNDSRDDPKFIVAMRTREHRWGNEAMGEIWETFGPGSHTASDLSGWMPLPAAP